MTVAVIGANGQLGSDLCEELRPRHEVGGLTHSDIDVTSVDSIRETLGRIRPDVVFNTAAYHNVPECEKDPSAAFKVNAIGALNLAQISNSLGFVLVHYSTDYVFDGLKRSPYVEGDKVNPLNVYGTSKLAGECLVSAYCRRYFIIRISGLYGRVPCRAKGENFVAKMIRLSKEKQELKVVDDEVLTPTYTVDVVRNTELLTETSEFGLYHMTNDGQCSWYEFACEIFNYLGIGTPVVKTSSSVLQSAVRRPMYSVLENANLERIGINRMSCWRDALHRFLEARPW